MFAQEIGLEPKSKTALHSPDSQPATTISVYLSFTLRSRHAFEPTSSKLKSPSTTKRQRRSAACRQARGQPTHLPAQQQSLGFRVLEQTDFASNGLSQTYQTSHR